MSFPWTSVLSLPLLLGAGSAETITFDAEQGTALEKVWTTRHTLRAIHMTRSLGEDSRAYQMRSDGIDCEETLGVVDQYERVGDGRPQKFRRRFDKGRRVSRLFDSGGGAGERIRQKAVLRGASVVFTWVEEEQAYGKYFDGIELEEELLAALRGDLDLLFVLPPGPVEVGASWSLAPAQLIDLFGRSGTFPYKEAAGEDQFLMRALDSGVAGSLEQAFGEFAEGTAEVTFRELRESDAGRIAVLELHCDVQYARDRTKFVQENTIRQELREGIEYLDAFLKLEIEGAAEIHWNIDEGLPVGLAFRGLETAYARITHRAPADPEGIERSQDVTMEGPLEITATFTRLP